MQAITSSSRASPESGVRRGGGETCDACELIIVPPEMVIEGITLAYGTGRLKSTTTVGRCNFDLWDLERRS